MKIFVNDNNRIQIEDCFEGISLKSPNGENFSIAMRDGAFEFFYNEKLFYAKEGKVAEFKTSSRGNILVNQNSHINDETTQIQHRR